MRLSYRALLVLLNLYNCYSSEDSCSASSTSEACILERLDSEERLEEAFAADPVTYRVSRRYLTSKLPNHERDITLCTQGSMDRLDRLHEQALAWHGSLSVAIFLSPAEFSDTTHESTISRIRGLHSEVEALGQCRLTISLLYGLRPSEARQEYDTLYPINALRNLAVEASRTDLIMVIDIDFIPSDGFWEFCTEESLFTYLKDVAVSQRRVWALISLELHETYLQLPREKLSMAECLKNNSVVVAETYLNPAAHAPVQIKEWLTRNEEHGPLEAGDGFEPFVLGSRLVLPLYDERFRGYGWDKTTHAQHIKAMGFSYFLLPHHFVIARYHHPTATAVRIFGDEPDTLLRLRMEWLFNRFITELLEIDTSTHPLPRVATHTESSMGWRE